MKVFVVLCQALAVAIAASVTPPEPEVVYVGQTLDPIQLQDVETKIPIDFTETVPPFDTRIVGGNDAVKHEYPFMVHLKSFTGDDGSYSQCGGTILSSKYILTAAHCVHFDDLKYIQVIAGDHNRERKDDAVTQDRWAVKIMYNGYNSQTIENDIAILELQYDLSFTPTVQQACLAAGSSTYAGWTGTVIGWGRTRHGGTSAAILQKLNMEILSRSECNRLGAGSATDKQICVIDRYNSRGVCHGDSGGPLVAYENGRYRQTGIASYITANCGTANAPSVYVRVTAYRSWIESRIGSGNLLRC